MNAEQAGGTGMRARLFLYGFLIIVGVFLLTEHWVHVWPFLPYLLFLACPVMHLFHHHGHGGHGKTPQAPADQPQAEKAAPAVKRAGDQ